MTRARIDHWLPIVLGIGVACSTGTVPADSRILVERGEGDPSEMRLALNELARKGDPIVVEPLLARLDWDDPGERAFAYETLLRFLEARGERSPGFRYSPWDPRTERQQRIAELGAFLRRWRTEPRNTDRG